MSENTDIDGNVSSKRMWASRLLTIGLVMAVLLFAASVWKAWSGEGFTADLAKEIMWSLLGTGAFSLGLTLNERWGKQKQK